MNLIRSHSGFRGIYGEQLTPKIAYIIANAYAKAIQPRIVLIGRDTRLSGSALKNAAIAGLTSAGVDVIDVDVAPTPAILFGVRLLNCDGGIIISASHNPPEWNAIKLAGREGLLLTSSQVDKIISELDKEEISPRQGTVRKLDITEKYIEELIKHVDKEAIGKAQLKVVVDPGGGAASHTTPKLLAKLGCKVITINSTPGLFTRKIEPTQDSLKDLQITVKAVGADAGFAHDCDADRIACVDEKGNAVREDYGVAVAVNHELAVEGHKKLVVNIASSKVFEDIAEMHGAEIYWSKVGEANVVRKMIEVDSEIGAEGSSGGLIIKKFHLARDGALAAIKILEAMAKSGEKLSKLIGKLPTYYLSKASLPCPPERIAEKIEKIAKRWSRIARIDLTDGIKIIGESWWILVRPSKTEPVIRIMTEAKSKEKASKLLKEVVNMVK